MINNLLPGEDANSNSKYFQNIVTWSTTSRTLKSLNGLVLNCMCASFVAIVSTYLEKDKHKYAKVNFRPQAMQYRLGISLFYASFPLFC